jgi:hypothetical protein
MNSGDSEKACSLMTPASVREVERPLKPLSVPRLGPRGGRQEVSPGRPATPCRKVLAHGFGPKLPVGSTTIDGQRAVVAMKDRDQLMHRIVLFRVDRDWRVDLARTWDHSFGTD